jgi:hypothetical protein
MRVQGVQGVQGAYTIAQYSICTAYESYGGLFDNLMEEFSSEYAYDKREIVEAIKRAEVCI